MEVAGAVTAQKETTTSEVNAPNIDFVTYTGEHQLPLIVGLIEKDLSEPYSVYTYRYFLNSWPHLCLLAMIEDKCIGVIISKSDYHRGILRGYIAMLAVDKTYRKVKIGTKLVLKTIEEMKSHHCEEVVLETEITNKAALGLYENLGFLRDKRLNRYYMNGVDAFRLKLML
ncbi:n-acetyltransferase mak3 [Planoprotostelium fungivorum]|uniref:N-acetyltransferase mak3 n=1 Tax=Planoprotostelium fungivorum TaxID=1890364 RepID=A0A2P6MTT9_9EUKA|nr:n-acetyltransferase mak3 [Planoprotostelium fungivorum]